MAKVYYKDDRVVLIHGDCIEAMQKLKCRFKACVTDPPYGTTHNKWDATIPFDSMWEQLHTVVSPSGAICLFGAEPFASLLRCSNLKEYKYDWVWHKNNVTGFLNSKKQPLRCVETISVFYKQQPLYTPQMRTGFKPYVAVHNGHTTNYGYEKGAITVSNGERFPIQVLDIKCSSSSKLHPTQKPVELIEYLIKTYTNEDDSVLDFTCGSGTTLIAGLNTGRKVVGIESDEGYCEVAKQRILKWYEEHK